MVFCDTLLQAGYSLYDCLSVSCLALQPGYLPAIDRRLLVIHQTGPPPIKLLVEYLLTVRFSFPRRYPSFDPLRILKQTLLKMVQDEYGAEFAGALAILWSLRDQSQAGIMQPSVIRKYLPNLLTYPNAKDLVIRVLRRYERALVDEVGRTNAGLIAYWKDFQEAFLIATNDPDTLHSIGSFSDFNYRLALAEPVSTDPEDALHDEWYCSGTTGIILAFMLALIIVIMVVQWRRSRRRPSQT